MEGAVNQHRGVRGQEEEAGLYKPENTVEERGRLAADYLSFPLCIFCYLCFISPSLHPQTDGGKKEERRAREGRRGRGEEGEEEGERGERGRGGIKLQTHQKKRVGERTNESSAEVTDEV